MKQNWRINLLGLGFLFAGLLVGYRLCYWQVLHSEELAAAAEKQHWVTFEIPAKRGEILASDNFLLAGNEQAFLVFATPDDLKEKPEKIAAQLAPFLTGDTVLKETEEMIKQRLNRDDLVWVPLQHKVSRETKETLEKLKIAGIGFEEEQKRSYPESSSAAHLLGFVGSDINGRDKGYFGIEGFYDLEIKGQSGFLKREKDASGRPILVGSSQEEKQTDGRTLQTTVDRVVQFIIEEKLKQGLKRYGAISGSVAVMEPKTGAIFAMASLPTYDPANFSQFERQLFPNPVVAFSYEPGSSFKVLVMAAALNEGVVTPETRCDRCFGPRQVSGYTISTWNEKYFPDSTMTEVIQHSDNVGMVFVGEKLGSQKLVEYLKKFGLGQITGIDLQEESSPALRRGLEWKEIDLATASFGQGVALTPIQMLRAVGAIANKGIIVKPFVVRKIIGGKGSNEVSIKEGKEIIKPATALMMTEMMVNAVDNGEAKWAKPVGYRIAGKTGTSQIPVAGHYDKEKTIASFVGFAPADDPKFVMLVTLREPTSSPWGSETAAPLWFDISRDLFTYYGILPE